MYWQFHYPKRTSFYPPDYDDPGLGGSETALVLLTRALAARGHRVEVYNCCYRPGNYNGVSWHHTWELPDAPVPDVTVAVRFDEALWPAQSSARRHLFWMLDDRTRGPQAFAQTFSRRNAALVVASHAMRQRITAANVDIPTCLIPLPVETHRYTQPIENRDPICLFSSMPNRGLDITLAFWPRIRATIPNAELWVTSGWQLWGFTNAEADDRWHQLLRGRPLPDGVRLLGARPRDELIAIQQRAAVTLYPSRFPEMFCLAAAESAAAGTPMITSPIDALKERIDHERTGILIPGDITEPATQDAFVTATIRLLTNDQHRTQLAHAARHTAQRLAPNLVALAWETAALSTADAGESVQTGKVP